MVVRSIDSDLHIDYTAVGQTTHLAARTEQMAMPGSILITADVLRLAEGYVRTGCEFCNRAYPLVVWGEIWMLPCESTFCT